MPTRRDFLVTATLTSVSLTVDGQETKRKDHKPAQSETAVPSGNFKRPAIICKYTGNQSIDAAYQMLTGGRDTLDAVLQVCRVQEDDPNDSSVGLGGLPNEEGVVELDACCMHGPTRRAGSVGGVRNIKNVSGVSKAVMENTGHVMLVGEGAERFAVAMGFPRENLLTERSRKSWLLWKEYHSTDDWWGPGLADPHWTPPSPSTTTSPRTSPTTAPQSKLWEERIQHLEERAAKLGIEPEFRMAAIRRVLFPPTGTIHCSALNEKGEISGCTTTSGLAYKLPGRCGDSPIIGAGCYTDQDVGSAGATGSGEENIKIAGAHTIVENMRHGMSPHEAGMDALKRIARNYNGDKDRLKYTDMTYYILHKDGAWAGVSLWEGYEAGKPHRITVHDGTKRAEKTANLFPGFSQAWPPTPGSLVH